jgi:hypothetical protein
MNNNKNSLDEAKKLNQQAANKASSKNSNYQMEAGSDYDLMEAKKLNAQSKKGPSANKNSSSN